MKVNVFSLILITMSILFYSGCNNKQDYIMKSEERDKYVLYVVGDELNGSELAEEGIDSVSKITNTNSYDAAKEKFPSFKIREGKANYFVFDYTGLKHQASSYKGLVNFLIKNPLK